MFPEMASDPKAGPGMDVTHVLNVTALAGLVQAVPPELILLDPENYAALVASTAALEAMPLAFQSTRAPEILHLRVRGFDANPIWLIRSALANCPDEAPTIYTTVLGYIEDSELRDSIRLDLSAAQQALAQGEWKGSTVLSGAAIEALLLWRLQEHERKSPGEILMALAMLVADKTLTHNPGADLEGSSWGLNQYVEVAAYLRIIKPDTATLVRLAKDFRNLIHPGRAARLRQKCDRATALSALAAVEAVGRDLEP
jgi:hypothetical protein